eukprot:CAMPEP_0194229580 /NCGR_PEP_ID=MMETSP0156-20130528/43965_1 /TAXON_ID=33649 /ORGANISM="Thalassionema nitzschioides, Strain L26-B" /LENGTH=559 /DNA_ID=CAMNT_0038962135 /DNA_START=1 /DNA_END=1679 /DNA_ORIENTATION=-
MVFDEYIPDHYKVKEYNTLPFGDKYDYEYGHGTHVVGSICGNTKDGTFGMATGVAPEAQVAFMDLGVGTTGSLRLPNSMEQVCITGRRSSILPTQKAKLHSASWGYGTSMYHGTSIIDIADKKAKLHSASWGSATDKSYNTQAKQMDEYMYQNDDFLMLIAAGNDGYSSDHIGTVGAPATSKNCLAVGASHSYGDGLDGGLLSLRLFGFQLGPNHLADFSSRGPTQDGRNKPDLCAPGKHILSAGAQPNRPGSCDPSSGRPSLKEGSADGVTWMAGTSMATPITAGHAAIVRQYFTQGFYDDYLPSNTNTNATTKHTMTHKNPSGALVKAVLMNGAQYLEGVGDGNGPQTLNPYDVHQNYGRISLADSLYLPGYSRVQVSVVWDRVPIGITINDNDDTRKTEITIDESNGCTADTLSVTLTWMDKPGMVGCNHKCLIHDLDLLVFRYTPDAAYQYSFPNGRTNSPDRHNNVERVQILSGVEDQQVHTIQVKAFDLDVESTQFAVVATGCFGGVAANQISQKDNNVYWNDNSRSERMWIAIGFGIGGGALSLLVCVGPVC